VGLLAAGLVRHAGGPRLERELPDQRRNIWSVLVRPVHRRDGGVPVRRDYLLADVYGSAAGRAPGSCTARTPSSCFVASGLVAKTLGIVKIGTSRCRCGSTRACSRGGCHPSTPRSGYAPREHRRLVPGAATGSDRARHPPEGLSRPAVSARGEAGLLKPSVSTSAAPRSRRSPSTCRAASCCAGACRRRGNDYAGNTRGDRRPRALDRGRARRHRQRGVGMPGALSPATGLVKERELRLAERARPRSRSLAAAEPAAPVRQRRELLRALGGDRTAPRPAPNASSASSSAPGRAEVSSSHGRRADRPERGAGEWGHNPLPWPRPGGVARSGVATAARRACIETFLSGPG